MRDRPLSLYERVLEGAGATGLPAAERPRPSAAVVLWRRVAAGDAANRRRLEVFWVERAAGLSFMGGWRAFPGGTVTKEDRRVAVEGEPSGLQEAPAGGALPESVTEGLGDLGPILAPGVLAGALRELFEEAGLLLARWSAAPPDALALAGARARLLAGETDFPGLLAELGARLDASPLGYAGRWLTPPLGPLRFDNRFFLVEWDRRRALQPAILGAEAAAGEWIEPAAALARWERGEVLAAPPILHLLRVLDEEGPAAGHPRLVAPSEVNLGPFRKIEFRPGVLLFPLATRTLPPASHTNAYLLGTREAVLVDPGSGNPDEIARLEAALADAEARLGRQVSAIWLTHHHPDHVGGAAALRESLGVPVLAHVETARRLAARGIPVDGELRDGERRLLDGTPGFAVRILHTPGHAPGHLCFLEERLGSLVCGDLVAGFGTVVIDPPEGDMDAYLASLERVKSLAPRVLLPGHGPAIAGAVARLEEYAAHRRWREGRVLEAWRAGLREPAAMVPSVYDDAPEPARPLAERQIVAHLERLRRQGRLEE